MTSYYLYAVSCPQLDGGLIKLGIADDIKKRVRSLQTGCPFKIEVLALWQFQIRAHASAAEKAAHRHFRASNTHGEWFRICIDSVRWFMRDYCSKWTVSGGVQIPVSGVTLPKSASERLAGRRAVSQKPGRDGGHRAASPAHSVVRLILDARKARLAADAAKEE